MKKKMRKRAIQTKQERETSDFVVVGLFTMFSSCLYWTYATYHVCIKCW